MKKTYRNFSNKEEAIAYHEAGHAIVRIYSPYAQHITRVTIVPCKDTLGSVKNKKPSQWFSSEIETDFLNPRAHVKLEQEIIVALAGSIAENKYYENRGEALNDLSGKFDREGALHFAMLGKGIESGTAYYDFCYAMAQEKVDHHWKEIGKLARKLLKHKTLTAPQVKMILYGGTLSARSIP